MLIFLFLKSPLAQNCGIGIRIVTFNHMYKGVERLFYLFACFVFGTYQTGNIAIGAYREFINRFIPGAVVLPISKSICFVLELVGCN